jgi:hypothetical protein
MSFFLASRRVVDEVLEEMANGMSSSSKIWKKPTSCANYAA